MFITHVFPCTLRTVPCEHMHDYASLHMCMLMQIPVLYSLYLTSHTQPNLHLHVHTQDPAILAWAARTVHWRDCAAAQAQVVHMLNFSLACGTSTGRTEKIDNLGGCFGSMEDVHRKDRAAAQAQVGNVVKCLVKCGMSTRETVQPH